MLGSFCFVLLETKSYVVAFVFAWVVAIELLWCPCGKYLESGASLLMLDPVLGKFVIHCFQEFVMEDFSRWYIK